MQIDIVFSGSPWMSHPSWRFLPLGGYLRIVIGDEPELMSAPILPYSYRHLYNLFAMRIVHLTTEFFVCPHTCITWFKHCVAVGLACSKLTGTPGNPRRQVLRCLKSLGEVLICSNMVIPRFPIFFASEKRYKTCII